MTSDELPSIDVIEAAKICRVSVKTIRRWMKSGTLNAVRVGGHYRTTIEWIRAVYRPVKANHGSEQEGDIDLGSHQEAMRNIALKYQINPKVSGA